MQLCEVRIFPVSEAIHLSLGAGWPEAARIHEALNRGGLHCKESFEYHPHVTLVHDLNPENVAAAMELAKRRWQEYSGIREFLVDHVTLVQNTLENVWTNLGEFSLRVPVSV